MDRFSTDIAFEDESMLKALTDGLDFVSDDPIDEFLGSTNCTEIIVSSLLMGLEMTDDNFQKVLDKISENRENTKLCKYLEFFDCRIDNNRLQKILDLVDEIGMKDLETINFSRNQITRDGFLAIHKFIFSNHFGYLKEICLAGNPIGDDGFNDVSHIIEVDMKDSRDFIHEQIELLQNQNINQKVNSINYSFIFDECSLTDKSIEGLFCFSALRKIQPSLHITFSLKSNLFSVIGKNQIIDNFKQAGVDVFIDGSFHSSALS
ncbi:hypothetical protein WA158_008474 [Blastocystis sp. Blastoise]